MREMLAPWGIDWGRAARKPNKRRVVIVAAALGVAALVATVTKLLLPTEAEVPPAYSASTKFYVDPDSLSAQWVRDHPKDPRAALIEKGIAAQPAADWMTDPDPRTLTENVRRDVLGAQRRHAVPTLVAYAIPDRDCGGASSGGARNYRAYRRWADWFGRGLGDSVSLVVLEPDSLANISCLPRRQQNERYSALSYAAATLHRADPHVRVYYDGGNSQWEPPNVMADRLRRAGIDENGNGIAVNVSNFNRTQDEIRYGDTILRQLSNSQLAMIVDTSRNGNGATRDHQFCDPKGRKVGQRPTPATGVNRVDAYLWIKHPGQADGCAAGAGQFVPWQAYDLLGGGRHRPLPVTGHHYSRQARPPGTAWRPSRAPLAGPQVAPRPPQGWPQSQQRGPSPQQHR